MNFSRLERLSQRFGITDVLDQVSFEVRAGEVVALAGAPRQAR